MLKQSFFFQALFAILILASGASKAQNVTQLMSAQGYNQMETGPEKEQQIRNLERKGWYHQDAYTDQRGNALESAKVDLSPFVDELGESVFLVTDISPAFPGGLMAQGDYLQNLLADLLAKPEEVTQNTLFIKFSVSNTGQIEAVEPAFPFPEWVPGTTTRRCLDAVREMPVWTPGIFKNKPVKVKMMLTFSLRA